MPSRRHIMGFLASGSLVSGTLASCAPKAGQAQYDELARALRANLRQSPELMGIVRSATLAASGHNTQPWRFEVAPSQVTIRPDLARRTPVVDPDDHHLFVSMGCALENLSLASGVAGRPATAMFSPVDGRIDVALEKGPPKASLLSDAIPFRQCTRSDYTGEAVSTDILKALESSTRTEGVTLLMITEPPKLKAISDLVIEGNNRQIDDRAFVAELTQWIRFNPEAAMATGDGLYSGASGSPTLPSWLGQRLFPVIFTKAGEAKKYASQLATSSGVAIFIGDKADKAHWVKVGRSYQRFALQATALGLKHAMINQPVEVTEVRAELARWLGTPNVRPDLCLRFGFAKALPLSLRRPVKDVIGHA